MGRKTRFAAWITSIIFALTLFPATVLFAGPKEIEREKELGKEAAAQAEKELKFVKDEALQKRIDGIGQKIAQVAKTVKVKASYGDDELADFDYVFKIVDDKDVNAFSLPGGYIYINKGLIDRVESDDELAGVIAHEVAHASHHHMAALLKKEARLNTNMLIVAAVAILSGAKGADTSNLLLGAQLVSIAKLNTYGREAERDSDMAAIEYMVQTGYNPVGLLTFMEKLARDQTYRQENLGIFATHPPSKERADAIIAELKRREIPLNRRAVSKTLEVTTKEVEVKGQKVSQVEISGKPFFTPAAANGQSSKDRAESIVKRLNKTLDKNPNARDVKIMSDDQGLILKGEIIVEFAPEDAKLAGMSQKALAQDVQQKLNRILYDSWLKSLYW